MEELSRTRLAEHTTQDESVGTELVASPRRQTFTSTRPSALFPTQGAEGGGAHDLTETNNHNATTVARATVKRQSI